jgi:hypothetical protein
LHTTPLAVCSEAEAEAAMRKKTGEMTNNAEEGRGQGADVLIIR